VRCTSDPVREITLFVFGGLASIGVSLRARSKEFNIAIAGPLSSFLLGVFLGARRGLPGNENVFGAGGLAGWINVILATFNLVPGFPLDGGRFCERGLGITGITCAPPELRRVRDA